MVAGRWKGIVSATEFAPQQRIEDLYADHHGWLQAWLRRKLGCSHHAADMAQDTFVSVITAGSAADIREPRPFLATIARRLMARHHRRQLLEASYLEMLAALPEELAPSPEARLLALEALQQVDRALDGLPPKVREAFLLAHLEELSYAQIAERLGVSASSVKQYLTRANRQCLFSIAP
ncbi:MAG: sigma-70 family RNA polymerase sigma factor [Acidovorax sp.]